MSEGPRTVSFDFIAAQLQKLFVELRDIKATTELDRRNGRAMYDNLAAEMTRVVGAIDGKLEFAVEHLEHRIDGLEQRFDGLERRFDGLEQRIEQRFDRIEALLQPKT